MDRFLVQVSKDAGYSNIRNNRKYENNKWMNKGRDADHGLVKSGDELLVYCTSSVPDYGMSFAFKVGVQEVSEDNVTLELDEPLYFASPLKFQYIRDLVDRNKLPKVFLKCGHQGFNITKLIPFHPDCAVNASYKLCIVIPAKAGIQRIRLGKHGVITMDWYYYL